jgi:hypothetical protein
VAELDGVSEPDGVMLGVAPALRLAEAEELELAVSELVGLEEAVAELVVVSEAVMDPVTLPVADTLLETAQMKGKRQGGGEADAEALSASMCSGRRCSHETCGYKTPLTGSQRLPIWNTSGCTEPAR